MEKKVLIQTEEELEFVAQEAFYILRKYVEYVTKWRSEYGATNRIQMDMWQNEAIKFLSNPLDRKGRDRTSLRIEIEEREKSKRKVKPIS